MAAQTRRANRSGGRAVSNTYDTGAASAALSLVTPIEAEPQRLLLVVVRYSAPVTADVEVTLKSGVGAAYDAPLRKTSIANGRTAVYLPDQEVLLLDGDAIQVDAPAGGDGVTASASVYLRTA